MLAARLLVGLYFLMHGKLHLKGAGWLIRRCMKVVPQLRAYPQPVRGAGTAVLDLRDSASYDVLNVLMGDPGPNREIFPWIERLVTAGDVVWDVGANVGYFSLYLSRKLPALRAIHAFEPNPKALKTLAPMFTKHSLVHVHEVGLADEDDTLQMQCPSDATPYGTLARQIADAETFPVAIRHGDRFREEAGIDLPDFIKIDVEGFEPQVFSGLGETLARSRPIVLFEHCWLEDQQLEGIKVSLPIEYRLLYLLKGGGSTFEESRRREGDDAIAFPAEEEGRVNACRSELAPVRMSSK